MRDDTTRRDREVLIIYGLEGKASFCMQLLFCSCTVLTAHRQPMYPFPPILDQDVTGNFVIFAQLKRRVVGN